MSEKLLLQTIEQLETHSISTEMLENTIKSLDHIVENDTFPGELQEVAVCRLIELKEQLDTRKKFEEEVLSTNEFKTKILHQYQQILNEEDDESLDVPSSESEEILRRMIRSERDGTLCFEYRGVVWEWNHNTNNWDFRPAD